LETRAKYRGKTHGRPVGTTTVNSSVRTREYLTTVEIERLKAAARKSSRYGHRDATMILVGYRHGLRASELCDLQWSQVELVTGRLHVRRAKHGFNHGAITRTCCEWNGPPNGVPSGPLLARRLLAKPLPHIPDVSRRVTAAEFVADAKLDVAAL